MDYCPPTNCYTDTKGEKHRIDVPYRGTVERTVASML
jgi:hypothetical protein